MPIMKFRGANLLKPTKPKVHPKDRLKQWPIYVGDTVEVIGGMKDLGKQGKIIKVLERDNAVLVEGCKLVIKHVKPNPGYPEGGRVQMESPISYKDVALLDPILNKPTDVKMVLIHNPAKGRTEWQRETLASQSLIPIPDKNPWDGQKDGSLDSLQEITNKVTWMPTIAGPPFPTSLMNQLYRLKRQNKENHGL
ncbi:translation protein SH3-like domain-containing protein [Polychytrium aggregatum]|uniref:translation protein SH3-like domain-containing protein n=1 Tax=Polychytrium aggregatum TaxID=110093 RepID=UPI0022FE35A7|nr:translation protein SH3-like domain-containing protein [Polychytrium aggregatum]KAI9205096.1 translation protein SH3-like domain-containing protein [Polychytrium aggregatum]